MSEDGVKRTLPATRYPASSDTMEAIELPSIVHDAITHFCADGDALAVSGKSEEATTEYDLRLGQVLLDAGEHDRAADELMRAYMGAGADLFASEDERYLSFLASRAALGCKTEKGREGQVPARQAPLRQERERPLPR